MNLGDGASGGFSHLFGETNQGAADVSEGNMPSFEFDFCTGGEMWSEENGDYRINAWLDLNGNSAVDPGEPAGFKQINLSCMDAPHCEGIELDCLDGISCFAFADGTCSCQQPACNSPIVTCQQGC
jgi:hypothetical protein